MTFQDVFDNMESSHIEYYTRHDYIGGEYYIELKRKGGKIILIIGSDEGEITIRTVDNIKEVERIVNALY